MYVEGGTQGNLSTGGTAVDCAHWPPPNQSTWSITTLWTLYLGALRPTPNQQEDRKNHDNTDININADTSPITKIKTEGTTTTTATARTTAATECNSADRQPGKHGPNKTFHEPEQLLSYVGSGHHIKLSRHCPRRFHCHSMAPR